MGKIPDKQKLLVTLLVVMLTIVQVHSGAYNAPIPHISEMRESNVLLEEEESPLTDDQIFEIIKDIIPVVEEAVGKKFRKPPLIKLVDRAGISNVLARNVIPKPKSRQRKHRDQNMQSTSKTNKMMEICTRSIQAWCLTTGRRLSLKLIMYRYSH